MEDILVRPGPCNIPIIDWDSFTNEQFLKEFAYEKPFVLRDGKDNTVILFKKYKVYFEPSKEKKTIQTLLVHRDLELTL